MSRLALVVHAVVPGDPRIRRQADALLAAGHEVDIFCLRRAGQAAEETDGGLRLIRLPVDRSGASFAAHLAEYLAFSALVAPRLVGEHRRRRYRLVQVATLPDFLAFSVIPLKLAGVPLLLDLHEDMPEFFRDRFAHPLLRPLLPVVAGTARAAAGLADALITVHEPLRQLSIARGVAPDKISVVMNSADPLLFDPTRHPRRPFMADGVLRLIHHSSLQPIYGLDVAIEAIRRLGGSPPVQLDANGEGPFRPTLEAAIIRTETAAQVRLHGQVPIDRLPELLAGADLAVVPTRPEPYLDYSLPTKLLEYAAMGVPTITTDLRTVRAHFTDAAVHFVPGADPDALAAALREAVADPKATVRRGVTAQREAAAYAWPNQARAYLDLVERLITSRA